jgi:predicted DNA-binding transcriptional regulator AlpA
MASQHETGEQLLTKRQLAQKLQVSMRSIDRRISQGEFPRGLKVGSSVRWRSSIIDAWISSNCPAEKKGGRR